MKRIVLLLSAIVFSVGGFAQTLIGHWNFANGTATDISGHNLNGTLNGGVTSTAGRDGVANTALLFDGTSGYVTVAPSSSLNLTQWTLAAIVKPTGFYSGTCQGNIIIQHSHEYASDFYRLGFWDSPYDHSCNVFSPTKESFYGCAAGYNNANWPSGNYIDTGVWYCVVGTYSNDTFKTYVDGVLTTIAYWPNQYSYGTPAALYFGSGVMNDASYPYWFKGAIDDIKIWNGALAADSVVAMCAQHDTLTETPDTATHTSVIEMHETNGVEIAPNVTTSYTKVILPVNCLTANVYLFNTMGEVVMTQTVSNNSNVIDVRSLPVGLYIVRIEHSGVVINRRLIKQ